MDNSTGVYDPGANYVFVAKDTFEIIIKKTEKRAKISCKEMSSTSSSNFPTGTRNIHLDCTLR